MVSLQAMSIMLTVKINKILQIQLKIKNRHLIVNMEMSNNEMRYYWGSTLSFKNKMYLVFYLKRYKFWLSL